MRKIILLQVKDILEEFPETRNSDSLLVVKVWQKYYNLGNIITDGKLLDVMRVAPYNTIVRYRAWFNQAPRHWFLPTSEKVAKFRGLRIEEWKRYIAYDIGKYRILPKEMNWFGKVKVYKPGVQERLL